ncbi:10035_t:CDS:2 [Dentiscutata heterogama]|uniref:10035_t:CDS:1 n=1 Tax=Dentiscutata heterogama TaxID=1316150 RepID=A0ACA9N6B7_9GLOM|nr:10035_t:CDS:2 [Dentiscutata heterogama]
MNNSSIIAVDILPHNDGKIVMYGAPNKDIKHLVSGKLRIILSKPLKIKFISIKLKGRSEYSDWEEQYSCLEVIKLEKILYEKNTLPIGVTDIEYELEVPGNLPQTFRTNFGFIFYKLVAVVQPASLMSKYARVERGISFLRHYLPCRREFLPAPPTKIYKGQRKDNLDFELELPTVICVNEKSLLIRLRLLPHNDKDLDEFSIDPAQLIGIVPLNGSSLTKRKRTYPISPTLLTVHNDADNWNNPLIYNLPFAQYSSSSNTSRKPRLKATLKSPLMKVRHKFRFVLMFEDDTENDWELEIPINVTTIPEEKSLSFLGLFEDNNLPSYDDTFMGNSSINHSENNESNISSPSSNVENDNGSNDQLLLSDKPKQPKLKQKTSLSLLKRILLRNENKSLNEDSSTSISPLISSCHNDESSRFGESSTSTSSNEQVTPVCYLNMPDDDDLDAGAAFEIRSEPSSPKLNGIPSSSFSSLNNLSLATKPKLHDISENNNNKHIHDTTQDKSHYNNLLMTGFDLNTINVQIPSPTLKLEHNLEEMSIN